MNVEQTVVQPSVVGTAPPGARAVRSRTLARILSFLMVFGPGLIVMVADNDAGAVSTYTQAGAQYGLQLLWLMLLLLPVTYFTQEMVVRLGIATGRGFAAMIYQRFGKWWGHFSLWDLELVNFLTLVTEFAAISLALSQMGIPSIVSVPTAAVTLIIMVVTGSYLRWERIAVALCILNLGWIAIALWSQPSPEAVAAGLVPQVPAGGLTGSLLFLVIAIVGTTIAPWQLFFQQSCVADKRLRFKDLNRERLDTFLGAAFTITNAACMMIVGYVLYTHHLPYENPAQMAVLLGPILGNVAKYGVLLLMVNAAVLGAATITLASAWAFGEVMGWPHSLQKPVREAPGFYAVYIVAIVAAAAIVLIPNAPLQLIIVGVQVLAGIMLPAAVILLQLLLNDRELLGEYANKRWNNWINWTVIAVLFVLSAILALQVLVPGLFPAG
jgi:Mn2+/Fe2+ NRAMP family transporter